MHRLGKQPHVPALPARPSHVSQIPHIWFLYHLALPRCSELNFPLSFHAALGTGRSSCSAAPASPLLPVRTRLSRPGEGAGRPGPAPASALPTNCSPAVPAAPCARGAAGPGLFALPLALRQVCSPPRSCLCWDAPVRGQTQCLVFAAPKVAFSPQKLAFFTQKCGLFSPKHFFPTLKLPF